MLEALERHPGVRLALHYTGPLLEWLRRRAARLPRSAARARRPRPGGDPRRRPVRAGPRVAARARPGRPADPDGRRSSRGSPAAGRAARGSPSGSGSPTCPTALADGRLPLDDPRRPALPGGVDPGGEPVGRLHDRGPGPPADRLRDGAGAALPDPVRERGGRHRLPARPRDRGRRPRRDDGRRRREVRRLAHDLRALLGRAALGRAVLRGARGEPRLADDGDPVRSGWTASRRSAASTCRPSSYAEMGEWALPPEETAGVHAAPPSRRRRAAGPRRAGCAAGSGATSRSSTARSTTSTSRCCARRRRSRRCRPARRASAAIDHLYRGQSNDCYWHGLFGGIYISHMRLATYEHLIAAEDAADRGARAPRGRRSRTSTSTGATRCWLADAGQVVAVKPGRGRRASARGTSGRRATRLAPSLRRRPEAYHETLRATRPRGRGGVDDGEAVPTRRRRDGDGAPTSIHDIVMVKEAGPRRAPALRRPRAALGAGPVPRRRTRRPRRSPTARERPSSGDLRDGTFAVDHLAPGQVSLSREGRVDGQPVAVSKSIRLLGGRLDPSSSSSSSSTTAATEPIEARLGHRAVAAPARRAAATRRPGTTSAASGRPTTGPGRRAGIEAIGYGNDWVGVAVRGHDRSRPRTPGGARSRRCRTPKPGFERVYQGSSLLLSWPLAAGARRGAPVRGDARRSTSPATAPPRRRGTRVTDDPTSGAERGRLVVHAHFYQPLRVDPFTGRVPEDASRGAVPRLERADHRRVLSPERRARHGRAHLAGTWARRSRATSPRPHPRSSRASPQRIGEGGGHRHRPGRSTTRSCRCAAVHDRRTEIRWGLRDFEVRFGRRPTRDVAARDRGRPRHARGARRGRDRGDDPRAVAGGGRADRRAATVPRGRRRRAPRRRRVLRRRPVRGGLVRACRDRGRRPVRPGAHPAADGPRRVGRGAADRRSSRATASCTGTTSRSATCSSSASWRPRRRRPTGGSTSSTWRRRSASPRAPRIPGPGSETGTSWSCHHGVLRWSAECPDVPDGRWKAPLRAALDRLAGGIDAVDGVARARAAAGRRRVGGARRVRRRDRRRGGGRGVRGRAAAARGDRRGPAAAQRPARGAALAARDVRLGRLVLGRPVASGDAPGPAVGGAGGPDRGRPRRAVARVAAWSPTSRSSDRRRSTSTAASSTAPR